MIRSFTVNRLHFLLLLLLSGVSCIGQGFVATPAQISIKSELGGRCQNPTYVFSDIQIKMINFGAAEISYKQSFDAKECPNGSCTTSVSQQTTNVVMTNNQLSITFSGIFVSHCSLVLANTFATFTFKSERYDSNPLSLYAFSGDLAVELYGVQSGKSSTKADFNFRSWDMFFALKGTKLEEPQANGHFYVCSSDNLQANITIYSPLGRTYNINIMQNGSLLRTIETITTRSDYFIGYYISVPFRISDLTSNMGGLELRVVEIINGREGYSGSRTIDVGKAPAIPLISASKPLLCSASESSELSVTNAESDINYVWSNGSSGVKTSVSGTGVYSVTAEAIAVGNTQVCPSVRSQDISIQALTFDPEIIKPASAAKCEGESIVLSVDPKGNGTFTYTWSKDGQTVGQEQMIEAKQSGVYAVNVKPNGTNCEAKNASNTITLKFDEPITDAKIASTGDKKAICGAPEQPSLELTAMPANLAYSWTHNGNGFGTGTQKVTITEGGRYEVRLTRGGCTTTQNIDIADNNFDPGIAETPLIYCSDSPITLKAKADNGQMYDYSWKRNNVSIGTNSPTLTLPAQAGVYRYQVEIVAKNSGCKEKTSQELTITSDPAIVNPTITPNPAIICNKSEGLTLSAVAENSTGIGYSWTGNGKAGSDPSKFIVYDAGTYSVSFQRGACKATAVVTPREEILAINLVEAGSSSPILICSGDNSVPLQLKVESNLSTATIKWYRQNGTEAPGTSTGSAYIPTETGTYYATAQFNTCTAKSPQTISTELIASFSTTILPENITPFCEDKSVRLEAQASRPNLSPRLTYTWTQDGNIVKTGPGSSGSSLTTGRRVQYTGNSLVERPEADFTVSVAVDGCKATSSIKKVTLKPSRTSITVLDGNTLEATESVDNAYQWYYKSEITASPDDTIRGYAPEPGATSRILMGAKRGTYFVRANRNECGVKNSLAYVVDHITAIGPEDEKEWKIYPNPALHTISVEQIRHNAAPATIELRNKGGQLLRLHKQTKSVENYPVDHLPAGVYILEINQGSRIINKKFVKQ